tara:strand:+ start:932 stop:2164 length:1233 start_codon:yes stop_codon:yes gene_type:complete
MKIKHCRFCNSSKLKLFLNLGNCQPADQFLNQPYSRSNAKKYPLEVIICESCSLVQLNFTCSGEILYQQDYPYESDVTREGREHWKKFAGDIVKRFKLNKNDLVIDIGSNVGELLSNFKEYGTRVCGIDPAYNIALKAIKRGVPTIVDFFNSSIIKTLKNKKLFPKIITGTNVFAHIDDINGSVDVVKKILLPDGVFVIEAPYLKNLLQGLEYDTIYHEHLTYLSIKPLKELFEKFDLEIFDVEFKDFHGGSIRVFVQHKNSCYAISDKILEIEKDEERLNIHNLRILKEFAKSVEEHKRQLLDTLKKLKEGGKKIAGVGAPAKGMTLLNFCEINTNYLEFVTEVSKLKIDRYCPGTDLKIISDEELIKNKIDYALILPWNFKNEIMKNLSSFKNKGGKFIIPLPKIEIV